MTDKSQMRQDIRDACSRILYEDSTYIIGVDSNGTDEHHLLVNDAYALLDKGIFNELARADAQRLESSLGMIGEQVLQEMRTENILLDELGWALAKAAIKDQEDFASYLVSEKHGLA
tara:strand:- start:37 stop:387 length:351 start_codon:yes stop_codon:yes gene_type:complete